MKTIIFGGAFDPPHEEHVKICKYAMNELEADRLVLLPTYSPPHKSAGFLSFEDRVELIKIAFAGIKGVEISDLEKHRGGDNYTYKTLPLLKEKYGDVYYLIGGDSFEHFDRWVHPEIIAKTCPIMVAGREGYESIFKSVSKMKAAFGGDYYIITSYVGKLISSSKIKAQLLMGEDPDGINPDVLAYIREHHLFEEYKWMVDKLKSYQTDELFNHSKEVVKMSLELNSKHNLKQDFTKIFLAAFLHDNAKQRPELDGLTVPEDAIGTPVLHQFLGALKAKRDFNIEDEEILDAIKYHTTAKADMTTFEKLIYTGDSLSRDRDYDPIPELREIALEDFDKGFKAVLKYTYDKAMAKAPDKIYPLTKDAMEYYLK